MSVLDDIGQLALAAGSAQARLRTTLRGLWRAPGFTLPAVLILAGGIGASSAIFSVVDGVLLEPLPFRDADQLVVLCEDHESLNGLCIGSVPTIQDLSQTASTLAGAGTARGRSFSMEDQGIIRGVAGGIASPEYLRVLGVQPILGRFFSTDEFGPDQGGVLILSHRLWASHFGGRLDGGRPVGSHR